MPNPLEITAVPADRIRRIPRIAGAGQVTVVVGGVAVGKAIRESEVYYLSRKSTAAGGAGWGTITETGPPNPDEQAPRQSSKVIVKRQRA